MKKILIVSLLALAACNGAGNDKKDPNQLPTSLVNNPATAGGTDTVSAARKPVMTFTDTVFDFGAIGDNDKVQHDFNFTNTGKTPLIISSAQGSCGCTVPQYPRQPIQPGESGVIKVTFSSHGKNGPQQKNVVIHTNTVKSAEIIFIKADVKKSDAK